MSSGTRRLIFEVSETEKRQHFQEVLDRIKALKIEHNQPSVYRNELCIKRNQFIHQYPDGRKFLIEQDQNNSSEKVLRELSK